MRPFCILEPVFAVILAITTLEVSCLPDPMAFTEGPCDSVQIAPVVADRATIDSFKFMPAGSKYTMFVISSSLPNYADVRDDQLYYGACLYRNTTSLRDTVASILGYGGREMISFNSEGNPSGRYLQLSPTDPTILENLGTVSETITLTDHKTFAFSYICLQKLNLRAWTVFSLSPNSIDEPTRKVIEGHALSLGFKPENFIFLRYDNCKEENI